MVLTNEMETVAAVLTDCLSSGSYGEAAIALIRVAAVRMPALRLEARKDGGCFLLGDGATSFPDGVSGQHLFAALAAVSDNPPLCRPEEARTTAINSRLSDIGKTATLHFGDGSDGVQELEIVFADLAEKLDFEALFNASLDGNRPLPCNRDSLGRMVREAWVRWAKTRPDPKPSWLVPYDELSEPDKEADRQIGETVARWTLAMDASRRSAMAWPPGDQ